MCSDYYIVFTVCNYFPLDGKEMAVSLSDILGFFTGADHPPPCGFPVSAALYFNNDAVLATASTCAKSAQLCIIKTH